MATVLVFSTQAQVGKVLGHEVYVNTSMPRGSHYSGFDIAQEGAKTTAFDRLSLKHKIANVRYHKRLGVILSFTVIGAPIGGFLLTQANIRQDKINAALYWKTINK